MSKDFITSNLENARNARHLTQGQVAEMLGVSRPTYIAIETGKKSPTIDQVERLADVLHLSVDKILGIGEDGEFYTNINATTEKYKQVILNCVKYGASKDGKVTKTKLAKLIYLSDVIYFYETTEMMTGTTYRKLPRGPVADVYFRALDELEEDGKIVREPKGKAILFSLVENEIPSGKLNESELSVIKKVGEAWKDKPTEEIVEFTHEQMPWQVCNDNEKILPGLIFQEEQSHIYGPVKL